MVNPRIGPPFIITLVARTATRFPRHPGLRNRTRSKVHRTRRGAMSSERKHRGPARLAEGPSEK
jgi:hypothetical protein